MYNEKDRTRLLYYLFFRHLAIKLGATMAEAEVVGLMLAASS